MIDQRIFGFILNILIFLISFYSMHTIKIVKPEFIFSLCMTLAFGWLVAGDIGYFFESIDLGVIEQIGSGVRFTIARIFILFGLLHLNISKLIYPNE